MKTALLSLTLLFRASIASVCPSEQEEYTPNLCKFLDWADSDVEGFAAHAYRWSVSNGHVIQSEQAVSKEAPPVNGNIRSEANQLPVVFAHGMGDSCFNSGMQHVTQVTGEWLGGVYAVCVPTGDSMSEDTKNGYFLNMDASVEIFASKIKADPKLAGGFHAIGFSQGNNVIRGYIAKHNSPTVHTFLSVNGVNAGIGAVPYCVPSSGGLRSDMDMCDLLMEQASAHAYSEFVQTHSFQANYWRDPRSKGFPKYQKHGQLAKWNNEAGFVNETLKENWAKTSRFVWVLATEDGMIWPKEGEQWGAPDPNDPFGSILPFKETAWYKEDLFGLKTADIAGKNVFESFEGDHLQFKSEDLERWVKSYLRDNSGAMTSKER